MIVLRPLLVLLFLILSGCASYSSLPDSYRSAQMPAASGQMPRQDYPGGDSNILSLLYGQYQEWQGTPYRWGGETRGGIDCSGLVQVTYRDLFGVNLPRSTAQQVHAGDFVSRDQLQPGDLIFFRTGFDNRHVGIYMEGERFMHASANGGVMISDLSDPYWRQHYWKAKRIPSE